MLGPLGHQRAEVELASSPPCMPMIDEPAAGGQRVDVPLRGMRAHDVEDHVGAATAVPLGRLDEVLGRVVDRDVGARALAARRAWPPARW